MAPRALMVRWRKDKMRRRMTQPKAFSTKGTANFTQWAMRELYSGHVPGKAETAYERLTHYIKKMRPHDNYLHQFFGPVLKQAADKLSDDPKLLAEVLMERHIAQDPRLEVYKYEHICLEESEYHCKLLYFRGYECFLILKRGDELRLSETYRSTDYLKRLPLKKVKWAQIIRVNPSPGD